MSRRLPCLLGGLGGLGGLVHFQQLAAVNPQLASASRCIVHHGQSQMVVVPRAAQHSACSDVTGSV